MELSKTEFKVSAYVTAGYDVKEIANKMFRSYYTVADHVKNIRLKNHLKNMAEISREFVLEFGDPRKFVAVVFLVLQSFSFVANNGLEIRKLRRTRRRVVKTSMVFKSNINYSISA